MKEIIDLLMTGGMALFVVFSITWLIQLQTKNAAIVDTVWSASFPLLVLIYFVSVDHGGTRQFLILGAVCVWGLRLATHLYLRTAGHPEDVRYTALRKEWGEKQNILMLRFYYVQAILALILSLPFALIMVNKDQGLSVIEMVGAGIWLIAVIGESTADAQLSRFKSNPANKGKICDSGLWRYSRHPNYFFEWLIWIGFFTMALGSPWGMTAIICPVIMYFFLTKVTGIVYTEEAMLKSRGQAFAEYQKTTSAFIPLPRKRKTDL